MLPEIGHFALILALFFSIAQAILPMWGAQKRNAALISLARPLVSGTFLLVTLAFICLSWAFYVNDFSVAYVANNSNSLLPWYYRLSAVWGAHEGSLLLWIWILVLWSLGVSVFSRQLADEDVARVISVLGFIAVGFLAFILITSNPFDRTFPAYPVDGRDLNPLLQDFGLIIHPPMLYMGYVGFSVAFAFAISALISGKLDATWARWTRPWTLAAWGFLTCGIALGSWWAYYELGWGGWWFWDPVENASFMPWLAGTALIHSLAVTEKRNAFKSWTLLLAITAFSLSLLGTFLVRSGILVSVHAFASDPERGLFILAYLIVVIGGALTLYAVRGSQVTSTHRYRLFSREVLLFINNILLVVALVVVLLGTLLPLVHKEIGLGSISIGEPFFNNVFAYLFVPFSLVLGIAPLIRWKQDKLTRNNKAILSAIAVTLVFALTCYFAYAIDNIWTLLGVTLALWITVLTIWEIIQNTKGEPNRLSKLPLSHWGMVMGHVGFAFLIAGIALTTFGTVEKDVRMAQSDKVNLGQYQFTLDRIREVKGPNYSSFVADVSVQKQSSLFTLHAEKRYYQVKSSVMTEAGIDAGFTRDLYVALGEQFDDGSWAVRVYVKPFVRWIWLGSIFMCIGAILCIADRRYRTVLSLRSKTVAVS
ncbi:heme lyase NrfEFG subunit NrfE [Saccharobesus litoralis]|uniref:Heme lyase NrfEFG subunit NrfE n=1 Tax=Saccharobesus litoralis TaxID=2172099 RepID=A0A2S0VT66_9ALTE|nr:heme lyase CcmF/NrfE family subunit [Saccharobesus litoralis]AWB67401.1 heme lyase NrfEFG subunit NrfE [Saccharobesus litoralis]